MEELQKIVQNMDAMEMIYWGMALLATVVFAIQAVMLFMGFDADADFSGGDADFDADGVNLVSLKTIACFLLGFGWTGALLYKTVENGAVLAGIAIAVGLLFMFLMAFMLRQVLKLSKDNTFSTLRVVGAVAEVYLRIPGDDECGKVTVSFEGSTHELLAYADEEIPTGHKVIIDKAIDESSVFVSPL